jgi:superoxide dismutase, Cu-Zn family
MIVSENAEQNILGTVTFRQTGPRQPVLVAMNITGLPPGKHAVHIHTFGDLSNGCKSTGTNVQGNMVREQPSKLCAIVMYILFY